MAEHETSPQTQPSEDTPQTEYTSVASSVATTHTEEEIDAENLHEPEEVQVMESAPPPSEQDELPVDVQEARAVEPVKSVKEDAKEEQKYGPFTGSGWMLAISIATFILALIVQAL